MDETALGAAALQSNTTGNLNTAAGFRALNANTTGTLNTAAGVNALFKNTTGSQNTAFGVNSMFNSISGSNNIALGYEAGINLNGGANDIDIGNVGVAAEAATIRIGTQGLQTATFIAGVSNASVTGDAVVVSSTGQLGIVVSSARYKHDNRDLGATSRKLLKLRPVSFRYNNDPTNTVQYGLVAEEVVKVYPELVAYGPDGKVMTVHYQELVPMLLNELQKQDRQLVEQNEKNQRQARQIQYLSAQVAQLKVMFQQALAAQRAPRNLAAAFNR